MGKQRRVAGVALSIAIVVVEAMIPGLSPIIGIPIIVLCSCALVVSLFPEHVRNTVRAIPALARTYPYVDCLIDWVVGVDTKDQGTMPGYEAILKLSEARPNSYETTSLNLADQARLKNVRAWGRPIPKMKISDHVTGLEEIPPDVWSYAAIDATLISGPLPQSRMKYRQPYVEPRERDQKTLYEAVCFNKKEVLEICRMERISASKKPVKPGN